MLFRSPLETKDTGGDNKGAKEGSIAYYNELLKKAKELKENAVSDDEFKAAEKLIVKIQGELENVKGRAFQVVTEFTTEILSASLEGLEAKFTDKYEERLAERNK